MVTRLSAAETRSLRAASFTYDDPGASARGSAPPGFRSFHDSRRLGPGSFEGAAERLMTWRVQEGAGLRVASSAGRISADDVVVLRLGVGPLALRIPCRVVYAVDEPDQVGFAYGTLPGHPEMGEERFMLQRDAAGAVDFTVSGFSRPATALARLGGPAARRFQDWMTTRYLRAI